MVNATVIFETEPGTCVRLAGPDPDLSDLVEYYISIEVPPDAAHPFCLIGLPSLHNLCAIPLTTYDKSVYDHENEQTVIFRDPMFLGILRTAVSCSYPPGSREFSVKFKPGIMPLLFDIAAGELLGNNLFAEAYLADNLVQRLKEAETVEQQVIIADNWLRKLASQIIKNHKMSTVTQALMVAGRQPDCRISGIAASVSTSPVTLTRYFKDMLGMSPAQCFRLMRFRTALEAYRAAGSKQLFDQFGYTDFSHFAKEARKLTKRAPGRL
ncbi:helix-turn-helix domain-containing protein [Pedobacter sp. SYP-B3415]|uniref:AraC family transcriptional regulator n=1 Tax=Pedobacter sp. SYP-B3415 TaxID=2496641 RepID=UPI00101D3BC1|nr:helix-turn-helix domain-containing protein [Pedobacter sp. SYP-B3415]